MADKDITIGIKTTGAQKAAADVKGVEKAVEGTAAAAPGTAKGIDGVAKSAKQLGTGKSGYGSKGNAGTAALEFSRAFEDAQYGIRGLLNNIPSLILAIGGSAGLAGVISSAAVAGSQLWTRLTKGPEAAKKSTEKYFETFRELAEVYQDIEGSGAAAFPGAASEALDRLRGLATDTTPDGTQGADLAAVIQSLQNNLTAKDATLSEGLQKVGDEAKAQAAQYEAILKTLEITPEDTAKITAAAKGVSDSIQKQGDATIAGFTAVQSVSAALAGRINSQQQQIDALRASIR